MHEGDGHNSRVVHGERETSRTITSDQLIARLRANPAPSCSMSAYGTELPLPLN
jgi:hypothetical protein